MKRIKILLMALAVALILTTVLSSNAVYAAEAKRNLTYQRTRPYSDDDGDKNKNIDNEEYTFARQKDGQEFKYSIVKIFDYDKRELETPYKKAV